MLKLKPHALRRGDRIAVIAPASWPDREKTLKAFQFLKARGLEVVYGEALARQYGYLAGTDQERVEELHQAFADPDIKAVFCVCGGYGTARIAAHINYELIQAHPKIFWGYSDITFLLNAIYQRTGLVTFHGPMLSSDLGLEDVHPLTQETFEQLFAPTTLCYTNALQALETIVPGKAEGPLVGGNLSLLVSTLGTPFEIDTRNKILFIEEVDEEPYRIDRMLNQLKMAGKLEQAAGIVLCDFHNCQPVKRKQSLTLDQIFKDHIAPLQKPTLSGFKIGHCSPNLAVPIGVMASMDTHKQALVIQEPGVSD
ncbi:peptidase U61 LD-carboxypeptidase A [Caldalkalibacillus thermarum TA2.A1]|uniref:Peptidase U61 LD-carboxypeptidase A n=1 Tax=Caldalkalibacillus thermarum (strain TA2.A1) TaxID=986075 RepID=F5L605_CALTT|nr:peptidase U61 LD-carboxypeptidase A [Caldalkalibacillus thermarum TA2.A1]